jgi:hypothetical protein
MGSLSDFSEKEILDHVLKVGAYSPGSTIYLALSTADPTDTGTGIAEPSGNGYARKAISFGAASGRTITQDAAVNYDQASGSWGTITHWALFDAVSGGNFLAHGAFSTGFPVGANDTPSVVSAEVYVAFNSGALSNYLAPLILDWLFDGGTLNVPTNLYVALVETTELVDSDTGSSIDELDMTGYSRTLHNSWNAATGESPALCDNNGAISVNSGSPLTGTAETVVSMAILDAASAGNLLFYTNTPNQLINDGNTVSIPSGGFDVTLA